MRSASHACPLHFGALFALTLLLGIGSASGRAERVDSDQPDMRAAQLHRAALVIDSHVDTTQRLSNLAFDFTTRHSDGSVDLPRMRAGGLDAAFFSIWLPPSTTGQPAIDGAQRQLVAIRNMVEQAPDHLVLATTADDIRVAHAAGRTAILVGIEGGQMIGSDLKVLRRFAAQGVRYLTLTHSLSHDWADSSTDVDRNGGLSAFGRTVVSEMNRLGMLVDISHASDRTFYDVLKASRAPVIASHSSCRALANHPRNLSDDMIRALAGNGGVIQINFAVQFLSNDMAQRFLQDEGAIKRELEGLADQACGADDSCWQIDYDRRIRERVRDGVLPRVDWRLIVEHIDHVVRLVGPDHVGLGSDFDGATPPDGMDSAEMLPRLTEALLARDYDAAAIRKILGGNLLRVMQEAEAIAAATVKAENDTPSASRRDDTGDPSALPFTGP